MPTLLHYENARCPSIGLHRWDDFESQPVRAIHARARYTRQPSLDGSRSGSLAHVGECFHLAHAHW